jgi:tyrosinase
MAALAVRKSVSRLTAEERSRFVEALLQLKRDGHYDEMVSVHVRAMVDIRPDPAHGASAFLPWHRYCLRHLEYHLQAVDSSVTLPYWDWTRDRSPTGLPWTEDFMGDGGRDPNGRVLTGPFSGTKRWPIRIKDWRGQPDFLTRFYRDPDAMLPKRWRLLRTLEITPYDSRPWNWRTRSRDSFRAALETSLHNIVHVVVGGNMAGAASPNDPVFYLHHAMVDRIWAMWQKRHPTEPYRPRKSGPRGHNRYDRMWPWKEIEPAVTPRSVLKYHALGYRYDDEEEWQGPAS